MFKVFIMPVIARITYWVWFITGSSRLEERLFNNETGWYWDYLL
jgi:hypothetical protein